MIEVNFFEKKAKNILPQLMVLFFLIGLIALSVYLFIMHGLYVSQNNQNNQVIQQRSEEVAFAREIQSTSQLTEQNEQAIATLKSNTYPIVYLTESIAATISDSEDTIVSFSLNEGNELLLQLNQSLIQDSADVIVSLEALPYIRRVQMNRLDNQQEELHLIELLVTIDDLILIEEAGE